MTAERATTHDQPASESGNPDQEARQGEARGSDGPLAPDEQARRGADSARSGQDDSADAGAASDADALRDRHLRLAAEFDNYRKRTERERAESWARAQAQILERLLEPLDDLQRVAHYDAESTSAAALLDGVQLVERKLLRVLEGLGVETIDAEDQPFDPAVHEAVATTPTNAREDDDTVAQVFQKGYRFKGNLLRPARVQVSKYDG